MVRYHHKAKIPFLLPNILSCFRNSQADLSLCSSSFELKKKLVKKPLSLSQEGFQTRVYTRILNIRFDQIKEPILKQTMKIQLDEAGSEMMSLYFCHTQEYPSKTNNVLRVFFKLVLLEKIGFLRGCPWEFFSLPHTLTKECHPFPIV